MHEWVNKDAWLWSDREECESCVNLTCAFGNSDRAMKFKFRDEAAQSYYVTRESRNSLKRANNLQREWFMKRSVGGKRLREQPLNQRICQDQRVHNIFSKQAYERCAPLRSLLAFVKHKLHISLCVLNWKFNESPRWIGELLVKNQIVPLSRIPVHFHLARSIKTERNLLCIALDVQTFVRLKLIDETHRRGRE